MTRSWNNEEVVAIPKKEIATLFLNFCDCLQINKKRQKQIFQGKIILGRILNSAFYNSNNYNKIHLVGSYRRGTANRYSSDIDAYYILPNALKNNYSVSQFNGPRELIQRVLSAINASQKSGYHVKVDGQTIMIHFDEGFVFELLPVFKKSASNEYWMPDLHHNGRWITVNTTDEERAFNEASRSFGLPFRHLCQMVREWRSFFDLSLKSILLDSLAVSFFEEHPKYAQVDYEFYLNMCRDFFRYLSAQSPGKAKVIAAKYPVDLKEEVVRQAARTADILEGLCQGGGSATLAYKQVLKKIFGRNFL